MSITCPSCQFIREDDQYSDIPEWKCPHCDIVYEKFIKNYNDSSIPATPSTLKPVDPSVRPESCAEPKGEQYEKVSTKRDTYQPEPTQSKASQFIERHELGHFVTAKGGLIMLLVFIVGFFAGREYFKYEVRQAVGSAFSGIGGQAADTNSALPSNSFKLPEIFTNAKSFPAFLIKKGYREFNAKLGGDAVTLDIQITNTFDKKIDGFNGLLIFNDIIGNEIKRLNITVTDSIDVGANLLWEGEMEYNQFIDSSRALRSAEREKIRVILQLKKVIFVDGTVEEFD
jgi:hypothetical protein